MKQSRLSKDRGLIFLLKDGKEVVLSRRQSVLFRKTRGPSHCGIDRRNIRNWIAIATRDQSPIRSRCSHCRNSPLNPMLSATGNLEMTHRSICLPRFPARWQADRYSPPRPVEVSRELVVLAGLQLGQQLPDGPLHFGEFLNERLSRNQTELTAILSLRVTWL